ncbi:MAG: hypothetical protein NDI61_10135 [Bdellovibrionaceae bacterium]|nr:hypothetical protein [Pseudobdellovibrionaceae bacterium]
MAKRPPASSSPTAEVNFDRYLHELGLKNYYANLHAHHYMEYRPTRDSEFPPDYVGPGKCAKMGSFPSDDGRPCRTGASGENEFVLPPNFREGTPIQKLDYFTMACDYARAEGGIDILFVTPHSKNGEGDGDTDTTADGFTNRHAMLSDINKKYKGDFYCGLGQEASSISKGNHVNIFGHFLTTNANASRPFFFPSGAFDRFYPEVKTRAAAGEKVILQFNHPDVSGDMYWGPFSAGIKKEKLNDYGIDDFPPLSCVRPNGAGRETCSTEKLPEALSRDLLKKTFANILASGGDAYRLIEVTETGGATSNSDTQFRRSHKRVAGNSTNSNRRMDDGLLAYIFLLDMGFKISPTANQDNHFYNYGSAIASRTGVLARSLAEADVLHALEQRLTYASEDQNSRLLLTAIDGTQDVLMGQDIQVKGEEMEIRVGYSDADAEGNADLRVYYYHESDDISYDRKADPKGPIRTIQFEQAGPRLPQASEAPIDWKGALVSGQVRSIRVPIRKGKSYLFVETTQADQDKMWSAPLFIEAH